MTTVTRNVVEIDGSNYALREGASKRVVINLFQTMIKAGVISVREEGYCDGAQSVITFRDEEFSVDCNLISATTKTTSPSTRSGKYALDDVLGYVASKLQYTPASPLCAKGSIQ
jgi:hypothetical protein